MSELVSGTIRQETRNGLVSIARRLQTQEKIQGLILGGTELPLILRDTKLGIPLLDTTDLHVREIVTWMLSKES